MNRLPLVALLMAVAVPAGSQAATLRVAVLPFEGPEGTRLGDEVAEDIVTTFVNGGGLDVVERSQLKLILANLGLENNPGVFENPAAAEKANKLLKASVVVVGSVSKVANDYVVRARGIDPKTASAIDKLADSQRGSDWQVAAVEVARVLYAKLTRGMPPDPLAMEKLVSNERSSAKLSVRFNKDLDRQLAGAMPVYFARDLAKLTITSSETGHLLVIGLGKGEVYQLFPPKAGAASEIRKGTALEIPNETYREFGIDPQGFELVGHAPSIEYVQVFFARKPIPAHVPDQRLDTNATLMVPKEYLERFLPDLRRKLATLDPNWNGTSAQYFYGVDEQSANVPLPGQDTAPEPVPPLVPPEPGENPAAQRQRGPEIRVPQAVGAASLAGRDLDSARAVARLDAMRNALESALGVMIQSKSLVDKYELVEDKIDLESQRGFVRVDQDLGEEQRAGSLVVKISAWVSISPVVRTLSSEAGLKQLYDDLERPRIVCGVRETVVDDKRDSGGVAETALVKHLKAAGLDVLDGTQLQSLEQRQKLQLALSGDEAAAQWLGTSLDREILLLGDATAAVGSRLTGIEPVCELNLKIINAADARILVAEPFHHFPGSLPGGNDGMACRQGLVKSVDALVHPAEGLGFIDRLLADWLSRPTVFTLKIAKAPKAKLDAFVARLKPRAVDLKKVTIDMTNPRSYRAQPDVFSRADLKQFSTAVSEVIVESPLRPRHAKAELEKAIEATGWEITNISGLLYDLTAK